MLVLDPKNPVGCHFLLALPPGLMPLQYDLVWDRLATILDGYGLEVPCRTTPATVVHIGG